MTTKFKNREEKKTVVVRDNSLVSFYSSIEKYYKNENKKLLFASRNLSEVSKQCEIKGKGYVEYNHLFEIYCLLEEL